MIRYRIERGPGDRLDVYDGPTRIGSVEPATGTTRARHARRWYAHSRHRPYGRHGNDRIALLEWIELARLSRFSR